MNPTRIAYMPLETYPEAIADKAILAAIKFAASLECKLHVTTFAVHMPQTSAGLGNFLLDVPGLVRAVEEKSKAECQRLQELVHVAAVERLNVEFASRTAMLGAAPDMAAAEARNYDLAILPWSGETVAAQDIIQSIIFESGRPVILVPHLAHLDNPNHIAVAWDDSRFAARALGDALPFLSEGGMISVLAVRDEKVQSGSNAANILTSSLIKRGFNARALETVLGQKTIAEELQELAISNGAQLLAMGGFGHSRIRDFVLGGATKGVIAQLRLPVLLSH